MGINNVGGGVFNTGNGVGGGASISLPFSPTQQAQFNNGTALLLPNYATATAAARSGQSNFDILNLGDSTTFGQGSNNSGTGDSVKLSYPTQLSTMFALKNDLIVNANGVAGDSVSGAESFLAHDSRVVAGSWTQSTALSLGGGLYRAVDNNSGPMKFTPTEQVDTFVVYYVTFTSGTGVFNIDINGGTPNVINSTTGLPQTILTSTITAALGINTLNLTWVSGTNGAFVAIIKAFNSAKKQANQINSGWPGAKAADIAGNSMPWSPLPAIALLAPKLTIAMIGINDWIAGTDLTAFKASYQSIITTCKSVGDMIIASPVPTAIATTPLATQKSYVDIMAALAVSNNCPYIDIWTLWGTQEANTSRYWTGNLIHPNMIGYNNIDQNFYNMIGNV